MLGNDPYASHARAAFTCRIGTRPKLGDPPSGTIQIFIPSWLLVSSL